MLIWDMDNSEYKHISRTNYNLDEMQDVDRRVDR